MSQSMLDMLRNRVATNMQNEALQRASEFGAGMLASGSPNFFTMLGAGARAQREGDATRMEELRRVAEAERQARAQQAEEQYRSEQNRIQAERYEAERPLREAQAAQARAMAGFYAGGGSGANRGALTERDLANLSLRAAQRAASEVRDPTPGSPEALTDTPDAATARQDERNRRAQTYLAEALAAAGRTPPPGAATPATPAPAAPAARIDARGNPIR
jgi:hypothetical protein